MLARPVRSAASHASRRSLFTLPVLPYPVEGGLLPTINAKGLDLHYNKHHQAYVNNANKLVTGTQFETGSLEQVIRDSAVNKAHAVVFNNTAQIWNHTFFWDGMSPSATKPSRALVDALTLHFGSVDQFVEKFSHHAVAAFGSGWTWLIDNDGQLELVNTSNAGTPLTMGPAVTPLLTLDVWEHSYYPTFENRRPEYVKNFWSNVNWNVVESRLAAIKRTTFAQ